MRSLVASRATRLRDLLQHMVWRLPLVGSALVSAEVHRIPRLPGRVLFVCKGNICRSVFAEHAARLVAGEGTGWTFSSGGLEARPGTRSPHQAVTTARRYGVDLEAHRSRPLSPDEVAQSDVVFVMEPHQRRHPLLREGAGSPPVLLLGAWCRKSGPSALLRDPYGRDEKEFERAFDRIESAVQALVGSFPASRGPSESAPRGA